MNVQGKVVLVTGAGSGIGKAAAILFSKCGALVGINCLDEAHGTAALQALEQPEHGLLVTGDVSQEEEAAGIAERMLARFGRIDILVNNAGIVLPGTILDSTAADWDRTMAVNVRSVFLLSRAVIPSMKQHGGGAIVNVASSIALRGAKNRAAYTASKGAVLSLTRSMALELIEDHIRVNAVSPGTVETPSLTARIQGSPNPEAAMAGFLAGQPIGRLGTPEEIAQAILFAASEEASFLVGANISVDGAETC